LGRAELSHSFLSALPRVRVGQPSEQPWPRVPLSRVADGWDPAVSRAFFLLPWPSRRPTLPSTESIGNLGTS
jgi:hypothetical protein